MIRHMANKWKKNVRTANVVTGISIALIIVTMMYMVVMRVDMENLNVVCWIPIVAVLGAVGDFIYRYKAQKFHDQFDHNRLRWYNGLLAPLQRLFMQVSRCIPVEERFLTATEKENLRVAFSYFVTQIHIYGVLDMDLEEQGKEVLGQDEVRQED